MSVPVEKAFYVLASVIMLGWVMWIGAEIMIPIIWAVIAVYVLNRAEHWLAGMPVFGWLPVWVRRTIILLAFTVALFALAFMVINSFDSIVKALPTYEANLERMVDEISLQLGFDNAPTWETLSQNFWERVDLRSYVLSAVGSIVGLGGTVFVVVIYAGFLMSESRAFRQKTLIALGRNAEQSMDLFEQVNQRIGDYLAVKTLINVILAVVSLIVMMLIGVEYAPFWAVLIGLMNYIPYVGSLIGVVFPVLLSLAQFGSIQTTAITAVLLTVVQVFVGNVLEPRLIGRSLNLSGFVVLVALVVWTTLWGLHGAILSMPMTSMLMIVLTASPATRPVAVLMSNDGDVDL